MSAFVLSIAFAAAPSSQPVMNAHPYRVVLAVDVPVTTALFGAWLVPEFFLDRIARPTCPCDRAGIVFDRGAEQPYRRGVAILSDVSVGTTLALAVGLDALHVGLSGAEWSGFFEDLLVMAEAVASAGAVTEAVKLLAQRPRPLLYFVTDPADPELTKPDNYLSFFSSHSSVAFAAVTSFALTTWFRRPHSWQAFLAIAGGAALAMSIAIERVLAGKHYPRDVVIGALVGTGIAAGIAFLHRRPLPLSMGVAPLTNGAMLSVGVRLP